MLFKVEKDRPVIESNPGLELIPEVGAATDKQLRFVILIHDPRSPIRYIPMEERRERAAQMAGYAWEADGSRPSKSTRDIINGNVEKVNTLEGLFKTKLLPAQDPNYDFLVAYDSQLEKMKELFKKPKQDEKEQRMALSFMKEYKGLIQQRKEIIELLNIEVEIPEEDATLDDSELSTLDMINEQSLEDYGE